MVNKHIVKLKENLKMFFIKRKIDALKVINSKFLGDTLEVMLYGLIFQAPFYLWIGTLNLKVYLLGVALYLLWKEFIEDIGEALSKIKLK